MNIVTSGGKMRQNGIGNGKTNFLQNGKKLLQLMKRLVINILLILKRMKVWLLNSNIQEYPKKKEYRVSISIKT